MKSVNNQDIRVIQLIDSLDIGGAERMAVNYSNILYGIVGFSGLVVSRKEGLLKSSLKEELPYLFLNKKKTIDFKAIYGLYKYLKKHRVNVVHAHSTSFFLAFLIKMIMPSIKIIWHDHMGRRKEKSYVINLLISFISIFFSEIIVVNKDLLNWSKRHFLNKNISYLPNLVISDFKIIGDTNLNGKEGKRIVCLANLRQPKNHLFLLKVFKLILETDNEWTLHLVGRDNQDDYSNELKKYINKNNLENNVFIYDARIDVYHILSQAQIGVLCSTQEGFPVTLLEYGLMNLGVISSSVGYSSTLIKDSVNGYLFESNSTEEFYNKLLKLISEKSVLINFSKEFNKEVLQNYSLEKNIHLLTLKYKKCLMNE